MPDHPTIRQFTTEDAAAVADVWRTVFAYTEARNQPERIIADKLAHQPELFFVVELNNRIVGTVMGGYDGHRGWIYSLAVLSEARGKGAGSALVKHVETKLIALGARKINLQVLTNNESVVEFYQRLGYAVEPRISMGKVIPPPNDVEPSDDRTDAP